MAQRVTVQLDDEHVDGLEEMNEAGDADSISEAMRLTCADGLRNRGYYNGVQTDTTLRRVARECARALSWIGMAWLALTLLFPVEVRALSVGAFAAAIGCVGVDKALEAHEPAVTNRLRALLSGGETA